MDDELFSMFTVVPTKQNGMIRLRDKSRCELPTEVVTLPQLQEQERKQRVAALAALFANADDAECGVGYENGVCEALPQPQWI